MRPFIRRLSSWVFGFVLFFCSAFLCQAAVVIISEGTDPNGFFIQSTPANTGDVYTSRTAAINVDAYQFAYWKLNKNL